MKKIIFLSLVLLLILVGCSNDSKEDNQSVSKSLDYTITGIEPGAGITEVTQNTINEYDELEGWTLSESSTAGMLAELDDAIKNEEPIIITGWSPHHMFIKHDLKYLEDPKKGMGEVEEVRTLVNKKLKNEKPSLYKILDQFSWDVKDLEMVMNDAQDTSFEEAADRWIQDNQKKVDEWFDGVEEIKSEDVELASVPWESEKASAAVIKQALEEKGYTVKITEVDPAILFEAVSNGDVDGTVAPWLPHTQGHLYEKHEGEFEDLGANLKGAKNGLVVPEYMDIDSIEDLEAKK